MSLVEPPMTARSDDAQEPTARDLRRVAAFVGIGHTDWAGDAAAVKAGRKPHDAYGYGVAAFRNALADAGIQRADIDGLIVGPTTAYERMGEMLGIDPRWGGQADAAGAIVQACMAIKSGLAEVVALVYGNDQKSVGRQYGGAQTPGSDAYLSYVYHTPWGLTSQGALYGLMYRRYMEVTGATERDLGQVAVAQRRSATANPHAVMQKAITIDDYLASDYIAEPLHIFDYCLVNDGGVALIVAEAGRARRMGGTPVYIQGFGRTDLNRGATTLEPRLLEFYRPGQRLAAQQVYAMAGIGPKDIDCLMVYDSFSCHVLFALEGFGFCGEGEAGAFIARTGIGVDGKLPINTGGGHLSESYMQGWAHQVEAVRQLRGQAGGRQVAKCRNVQYVSEVSGKVFSYIYGL